MEVLAKIDRFYDDLSPNDSLEVKVCFFSPPNTHLITEGKNSFAVSVDFGPKPHFFPALQRKKRALEIRKPVRSLQKASIVIKSRQKQPDLDRFTNKSRLLHRSPALSFLFSVKDYKYQGQDRIKKKHHKLRDLSDSRAKELLFSTFSTVLLQIASLGN